MVVGEIVDVLAVAARLHEPQAPEQTKLMEESEQMDFTVADRAPADKLNEIIWKMTKGADAKLPPTPHGIAGVTMAKPKDDDDDD